MTLIFYNLCWAPDTFLFIALVWELATFVCECYICIGWLRQLAARWHFVVESGWAEGSRSREARSDRWHVVPRRPWTRTYICQSFHHATVYSINSYWPVWVWRRDGQALHPLSPLSSSVWTKFDKTFDIRESDARIYLDFKVIAIMGAAKDPIKYLLIRVYASCS